MKFLFANTGVLGFGETIFGRWRRNWTSFETGNYEVVPEIIPSMS